jgi:hypothetical protein
MSLYDFSKDFAGPLATAFAAAAFPMLRNNMIWKKVITLKFES